MKVGDRTLRVNCNGGCKVLNGCHVVALVLEDKPALQKHHLIIGQLLKHPREQTQRFFKLSGAPVHQALVIHGANQVLVVLLRQTKVVDSLLDERLLAGQVAHRR